jgi:ribulose-5-phosphate 4-epimerase/fuculose-1-phosphate aldolase
MARVASAVIAALALLAAVNAQVMAQPAQQTMPELVADFVDGNRILADQGIIADGFGHMSFRSPAEPERFFMSRARAAGMVTADDIMEFDIDGKPLDQQSRRMFSERFIHAEIYRARPDVRSVVHSHAPSVLPFGVTGTPLRPVSHMAGFLLRAVPVFEIREAGGPATDMLVRDRELGAALARTLGPAPVVLMRGHGFNTVGSSIRQAVSRAIYTDFNARVLTEALKMGPVTYINESEAAKIAETNDASLGRSWEIWRVKALAAAPRP